MKNILLVAAVAAVLAILTSVAVASVVLPVPQFGAEAPVISLNGNDITITGTAIDMVGASVQLNCNGNVVADSPVIAGAYTIHTVFGGINGCEQGEALLIMGDAKISINLQKQTWAVTATGGSDKPKAPVVPIDHAVDQFGAFSTDGRVPGVPEFSVLTMGLAIVGVGLGLASLRKQ